MTTVIAKCLLETKYAENSQTTQYTCPAGTRTIIDKITASNNSGANQTLAINVVPSGGSAGASNLIVPAKTIVDTASPELFPGIVGRVLNPGDFISTLASAASAIVIRIEGREISG
jgi:hypothetical protein